MRVCQPSPHVREHILHADHSSPEAESTEEEGAGKGWENRRKGKKEEKKRRGPELIIMQDAESVAKRGRVVL